MDITTGLQRESRLRGDPCRGIALFRRERQTAQSRFRVTVIDALTGRVIGKTEEVDGRTTFTRLTILPIVLEWSDIDEPVEQ